MYPQLGTSRGYINRESMRIGITIAMNLEHAPQPEGVGSSIVISGIRANRLVPQTLPKRDEKV